jgi:hypothetical protein
MSMGEKNKNFLTLLDSSPNAVFVTGGAQPFNGAKV